MKTSIAISIICCIIGFGYVSDSHIVFDYPSYFPVPEYDFKSNPLDSNKILLGRALFYDPILSADNTISCASCHSPHNSFAHTDHELSHGIGDAIGTRNAPALINLAWNTSFMWDGAIRNLDMQALAPIEHPQEMGLAFAKAVKKVQASELYKGLFFNAYGDSIATGQWTLKAMAQFQLTLVSRNTKYDRVQQGSEQYTAQEENGYALFKTHCSSCHTEPLFTDYSFASNGIGIDTTLNDYGRMAVTGLKQDSLKFKVPSLRNLEYSYPYMHDGRFRKLSEVLKHYTTGVEHSTNIDQRLSRSIRLTSNERVDLLSFLLTLTDQDFVLNKEYRYPREVFYPLR